MTLYSEANNNKIDTIAFYDISKQTTQCAVLKAQNTLYVDYKILHFSNATFSIRITYVIGKGLL